MTDLDMLGVTSGADARAVTVSAVNPLEYALEIKELFRTHQRPEFPDYFDRAYPQAVARGATSWIGWDGDGKLVMHLAYFPRCFQFGPHTLAAGLMVNMMVASAYRSFFPALGLVQRLVQDVRVRGGMDFLYADPNEASVAVLRGTRFARMGTLRRYVLPVRHRRPYLDPALRVFHALVCVAGRAPVRATVISHAAQGFSAETFAAPHRDSLRVAAHHDQALYASRLPGYPGDSDWWVTGRNGATARPEAALLVRGPDASGLAVLHAIRVAPGFPLPALIPGFIAELRRRGCERLQASTVAESDLAAALQRCGFLVRAETVPLFALPLTPLGKQCVQAVKDWEITDLDCDR